MDKYTYATVRRSLFQSAASFGLLAFLIAMPRLASSFVVERATNSRGTSHFVPPKPPFFERLNSCFVAPRASDPREQPAVKTIMNSSFSLDKFSLEAMAITLSPAQNKKKQHKTNSVAYSEKLTSSWSPPKWENIAPEDRTDWEYRETYNLNKRLNAIIQNGHPCDRQVPQDALTLLKEAEDAYRAFKREQHGEEGKDMQLFTDHIPIPDTCSYTTVIEGFSKYGLPHQAEKLLNYMEEQYGPSKAEARSGDARRMRPNRITYNAVINAWAESDGLEEAPDRAMAILAKLEAADSSSSDTKTTGIFPDIVTYNSCLSALANSGKAREAEEIVQRMVDRCSNAENPLAPRPDTITYSTLIHGWAKSDDEEAPARAEQILENMERLHQEGDENVTPTAFGVNACMHAWAKRGNIDRAEVILHRLEDLALDGGRPELKPDSVSYNTVITFLAISNRPESAERIESIMSRMSALDVKPCVITLNALITAFARQRTPWGADEAERILTMMETNDEDFVSPNGFSYSLVIDALSRIVDAPE
jgi:pentatricopeptide repeat protein